MYLVDYHLKEDQSLDGFDSRNQFAKQGNSQNDSSRNKGYEQTSA